MCLSRAVRRTSPRSGPGTRGRSPFRCVTASPPRNRALALSLFNDTDRVGARFIAPTGLRETVFEALLGFSRIRPEGTALADEGWALGQESTSIFGIAGTRKGYRNSSSTGETLPVRAHRQILDPVRLVRVHWCHDEIRACGGPVSSPSRDTIWSSHFYQGGGVP